MILITTSDYFPKIGGLTTFTKNIEEALIQLNIEYELFHWNNFQEINNYPEEKLMSYDFIINIHSMFSWGKEKYHEKMINFIHGHEILMYSKNIFKNLYKKSQKNNFYEKMYKSYLNIFISNFTMQKCKSNGFKVKYDRDIIFHNCIDLKESEFIKKSILDNVLIFSCIARDVPHKNIKGTIEFCEMLSDYSSSKIVLYLSNGTNYYSEKIEIKTVESKEDNDRDKVYKLSHLNLLFSLDHSKKGFFEGFGLTVLEAGMFGVPSVVLNTGGLSESVHHLFTGVVLNSLSINEVKNFLEYLNEENYLKLQINCFEHTKKSHGVNHYQNLFRSLLQLKVAA